MRPDLPKIMLTSISQESAYEPAFWAAVAAMLTVAITIVLHINERVKDRRQRHVESMLRFTDDFYNNPQISALFLKVQGHNLSHQSIKPGLQDELALAHLLEYLNTLGIALERKLVSLKAIAATSIAYIVLTMWRNDIVKKYLVDTEIQHENLGIPSPGWQQFKYLAHRLEVFAKKHPGKPDLRPLYRRFKKPNGNGSARP
jgi:hypothetical protein